MLTVASTSAPPKASTLWGSQKRALMLLLHYEREYLTSWYRVATEEVLQTSSYTPTATTASPSSEDITIAWVASSTGQIRQDSNTEQLLAFCQRNTTGKTTIKTNQPTLGGPFHRPATQKQHFPVSTFQRATTPTDPSTCTPSQRCRLTALLPLDRQPSTYSRH